MSRAIFITLFKQLAGRFIAADIPDFLVFWDTAEEAAGEYRPLIIAVSILSGEKKKYQTISKIPKN